MNLWKKYCLHYKDVIEYLGDKAISDWEKRALVSLIG
jgi:hypothetical protein